MMPGASAQPPGPVIRTVSVNFTSGTSGASPASGASGVNPADVAVASGLRAGREFNPAALTGAESSILAFYLSEGFYSASIDSTSVLYAPDSSSVDVEFIVTEGPRARIESLTLTGLPEESVERASEWISTGVGDLLRDDVLDEDLRRLASGLDAMGYPFATASVAELELSGDGTGLAIGIRVDTGAIPTITEFRVEGNASTKTDVILRESRIDLPAPYDRNRLTAMKDRLQRLEIFSRVEEPGLYRVTRQGTAGTAPETGAGEPETGAGEPGTGAGEPEAAQAPEAWGLLLRVEEGNANRFDGIVGYVPAGDAGGNGGGGSTGGTVTGFVTIGMKNLFGTARRLDLVWSRDAAETGDIGVSYTEPWFFSLPVDLTGEFRQRRQDSAYVRWSIGGELSFAASSTFSAAASLRRVEVIPGAPATSLSHSTSVTTGVLLRYDTRDVPLAPRRGVRYESRYDIGTKRVNGQPASGPDLPWNVTVQELWLDLSMFIPVGRQVLATSIHGRKLTSDNIEPADLYYLGGFAGLRGFRQNFFRGSGLAWGSLEYRFPTDRLSFFYGFFDAGYIYSPVPSPTETITYGYGAGFRVETVLGIVGVSFALGEGDPVSATKIHFGLVNDF